MSKSSVRGVVIEHESSMNAAKLQSIFALVLVLAWTGELAATSNAATSEVKVAIVLDHPDENIAELEVVSRFILALNSTGISVRPVPIYIRNASFAQATSQFCSRILQNGVSVVVLHTQNMKHAHLFAGLSSHFSLPVMGDAKQDPLFPDKNYYSTFVQTSPPETEQFAVVYNFLRYIGKQSNMIVIVSDEVNKHLARGFFNGVMADSVTVIRINTSSLVHSHDLRKKLLRIKSSAAQAVFLHCEQNLAHLVLWLAKDFGLINEEYTWIVSDGIVQSTQDLYTLPSSIYGLRENVPSSLNQLEQSLFLIQRTFEVIPIETRIHYSGMHLDCYGEDTWSYGERLYEQLLQTWQRRDLQRQSSKGAKDVYSYEVLFLQDTFDYEWARLGLWQNGAITLHSSKISQINGQGAGRLPRLRAAVVEYPPLTMQVPYDPRTGCRVGLQCVRYLHSSDNFTTHCCYGLAIDVLKYMSKELQFEPFVYFTRDGNYGARNTTSGTWNGIVRDLLEERADISIDLMSNEARSEVLDFSMRWTPAGLALLVLVGEKDVESIDFSFSHPFTIGLWASMIGVVNLYLLCMWFADRSSPYGHKQSQEATDHNKFDLVGSMWYCWGICFDNLFIDTRPRSCSARMLALSLATFVLLCLTSYTANLTAHLVSDDTKPDISGIRDPKITAPGSRVTYGVVKSSYVDSYFELNQDPTMREMFRRMRERSHLVSNFTDGVQRVSQRKMDIFISEILSLDYQVAKQKTNSYPRLQVVGAADTFGESGYSYAFRKNSPWKPKFDLVINRIKAENLPSELYKKWVSSGRSTSDEYHERLDMHSLSGIFFLGSSLVIVAIIFLCFENKLYSLGLIYKDICRESTETGELGKRKRSVEVRQKLLSGQTRREKEKDENELYPDMSNYLHDRRRSTAMLKSMYNPKAAKSKYDLMIQSDIPATTACIAQCRAPSQVEPASQPANQF